MLIIPSTHHLTWVRRCIVVVVVSTLALGVPTSLVSAAPSGPSPQSSDVLDVAHRGASGYAPENTLAAIDEAAVRGASTVEIDVQRTADGVPILMHDVDLVRTTDVEEVFPYRDSYLVGDFTLAEMQQLDAGSWFDEQFAGEPVPTLQESLDQLKANKLGLLLEIKESDRHQGIEEDIAEVFDDNAWFLAPGSLPGNRGNYRLAIQDFNWETVESSRELFPSHVPHGLLGVVPEDELVDYAEWADQVNPNHNNIDAGYVQAVHDAGMQVHVYTVNDPEDMERAIELGVDGIITDYVDVLLDLLNRPGPPPWIGQG